MKTKTKTQPKTQKKKRPKDARDLTALKKAELIQEKKQLKEDTQ